MVYCALGGALDWCSRAVLSIGALNGTLDCQSPGRLLFLLVNWYIVFVFIGPAAERCGMVLTGPNCACSCCLGPFVDSSILQCLRLELLPIGVTRLWLLNSALSVLPLLSIYQQREDVR